MSWLVSEITSAMRISSRSSVPSLRTVIEPGSSSMIVGAVIQLDGL